MEISRYSYYFEYAFICHELHFEHYGTQRSRDIISGENFLILKILNLTWMLGYDEGLKGSTINIGIRNPHKNAMIYSN